jgi:hypothetical protein
MCCKLVIPPEPNEHYTGLNYTISMSSVRIASVPLIPAIISMAMHTLASRLFAFYSGIICNVTPRESPGLSRPGWRPVV